MLPTTTIGLRMTFMANSYFMAAFAAPIESEINLKTVTDDSLASDFKDGRCTVLLEFQHF